MVETIKKVLVLVTSVVLIALAGYLIYISLQRQPTVAYKKEWKQPERPPETTPPEKKEAPGEEEKPRVEKPRAIPDTIVWRVNPPEKLPRDERQLYMGNPNPVFTHAAKQILPAVVTIQSTMKVKRMPDDFYHRFWKKDQKKEDNNPEDEEEYRPGTGSGIIISANGFILTNYHVVEDAKDIRVILYDKREFSGEYIGGDPNTDVALLKIEAKNLPTAYMGNSDSVQIGEWVMAVGSPLNFTSTITAGIISALGRDINIINQRYRIENFIQTDAVINPGNSGGALINLKGEVIGINTAIATRTGLYQGYGFAIPSNLAMRVVNDIVKYGEVRRGLLGVSIGPVDGPTAKGLGLEVPKGALVHGVEPGSPAEKAGIKEGDVILKVDGEEVHSVNDLQSKIARHHPDEVVQVEVWRDKKSLTFSVKLGMAPIVEKPRKRVDRKKELRKFKNLGLRVRDLTGEEKTEYEVDGGVWIEGVQPGSPAYEARIFQNEIIMSLDDELVKDRTDFEQKLSHFKPGEVVKFKIRRKLMDGSYSDRIVFVEFPE